MTGPGSLLPPPALADFTQAMHHESFWVRRLTRMRPLRLPIDEEPAAVEAIGVDIPSWVSDDVTIAAAALAYLGEVTGESGFSVGLRVVPQSDLLASVVPLEVPERSEEVPLRLARTVDRGSYLRDVVARYPALRARDLSMPVVLDLTNSTTPLEVPLTIHVYRGGCSFVATEGLARSLAGGFGAFLEWLPTAGARRAPLVSAAEYEWQVSGCNDTSVEYPRQAQVHELMLEQAAAHPAKTAVVCGTEVLSYEQLAERSGRLAGYLAVRGAGPGTRVGVYLERSVDLVVTLLAVLRTGAAYVPLDPVYPAERIEYALKDAATTLVVTQTSLARNVGADAIVLDTCCEAVAAEAPPRGSRRGELAYVIYISGSTGRPKGVQVGHVALTNFLCSMRNEPGFGSDDTMLAITPICFDVAALELFLPLIAGGTVHIAPAGTAGDGAGLSGLLRRVGPTHLQATPVTWKQLLAAGWTGDAGLTALCGGAALPRDLADELLARCGELWKMYGPAETTVWSTIWQVTRGDKSSIGTPIANTACHVLDPELRVLPAGFPGELYIGGDGVAAGYRHQPELTALKFTTQPYGVTLYRTGDLVTRDRDGKLCYLGRGPCRVAAS